MSIKTVNVITLGCSKNLVDSEHLMSQFDANGLDVVHDSEEMADIVIINTCGFILDAKTESVNMILECVEAKKSGQIKKLYVMGCLSARYREELAEEIPEVDHFFGKFDMDAIIDEIGIQKRKDLLFDRHITTPNHFAYLKISEGCNRKCSFCAIPQFTGKHKSVPVESLVAEATMLANKGVKEILLIAQDLSSYGYDLYKESRLEQLITLISKIKGIEWIRLHYMYPTNFPLNILKVMRENPKVCKYIDMPLQHASDNMLDKMRRATTNAKTRELIEKIRAEVPGIALRTTMLVGHPGETEADFEELKTFVEEMKFERLGVFPYSHEEKTFAALNYEDDVPEEIKQERADEIMELQQNISEKLTAERIGETIKVLIDREEGEYMIGRTEYDSPEVDGEVLVTMDEDLEIGKLYNIQITGSFMYDLYGELVK